MVVTVVVKGQCHRCHCRGKRTRFGRGKRQCHGRYRGTRPWPWWKPLSFWKLQFLLGKLVKGQCHEIFDPFLWRYTFFANIFAKLNFYAKPFLPTLTHGNFVYFRKSKKLIKNVIWYFRKLGSLQLLILLTPCRVVVDYADMCWNSHWLSGHNVGVVVDYADIVIVIE